MIGLTELIPFCENSPGYSIENRSFPFRSRLDSPSARPHRRRRKSTSNILRRPAGDAQAGGGLDINHPIPDLPRRSVAFAEIQRQGCIGYLDQEQNIAGKRVPSVPFLNQPHKVRFRELPDSGSRMGFLIRKSPASVRCAQSSILPNSLPPPRGPGRWIHLPNLLESISTR